MVITDVIEEYEKAKDSLYAARRHGSLELILMYTETVRVLERIIGRYHDRTRSHREWYARDLEE